MRTGLIVLAFIAATATGARAFQSAPAADKALPLARFDAVSHDFGTIWSGQVVRHAFRLTNAGNADLHITGVDVPPGCRLAGNFRSRLAPGESADLSVILETRALTGPFAQSLTIRTNGVVAPETTLTLRGTTRPPIVIDPPVIAFGRIQTTEPLTATATIYNATDEPVDISLASPGESQFGFDLIETEPGTNYRLRVTARPPFFSGAIGTTVVLLTTSPYQPELTVQVDGLVPPRLELLPPAIFLGELRKRPGWGKDGYEQVVVFANNGQDDVRITAARPDDDAVNAELSTILEGRSYRLVVRIPPNYVAPDGSTIVLDTDDSQYPLLRLPIRNDSHDDHAHHGERGDDLEFPAIMNMIGQVAPAFELTTTEGIPVTRADCARGITILNFFAASGTHNFEQLRRTIPLYEAFAPRGVRWIHVHERHPTTELTQDRMMGIMQKQGIKGELCFDLGNQVARSFSLMMYPTMVVLNQSGVVEAVNEGNAEGLEQNVTQQLETLLEGKSLVPGPQEEMLRRRPALSLVGHEAPALALDLRDDSKLSNASLSDAAATVVNFISPDCRFCSRQAPTVRTLRNRFISRGVRFAAVGMPPQKDMSEDDYRQAMNQLCNHNAWARDADGAATAAFKISKHPTLIVIDGDGVVRHVEIGAGEDVEAEVNKQLEAIVGANGKPAS